MRAYLFGTIAAAALLHSSSILYAQAPLSLPGCEPSPAMVKIMDEGLDPKQLYKMKTPERVARERELLEDLIAKYPREFKSYETLISRMRSEDPDSIPAYRDRFVKMAEDHPDDPLALMLAGWILYGKDTPKSLQLLETAKAKAPNFPWPSMELAAEYFSGKRADQNKVKENLEFFFSICPASTDSYAHWLLNKDPDLQPKVAQALRLRLEKETDPKRLKDYAVLWGMEFRTRPPAEHDALRVQIATDLKRLEAMNPTGDAEWQAFMINGYKQSGATKETITAAEDRLMREYPKSGEAEEIVRDRWDKAHKTPEDQSDAAAWANYKKEYVRAIQLWIRDYPDDIYMQRGERFNAAVNDDTISEKEGVAALDIFVQSVKDYDFSYSLAWSYASAAQFLIEHNWQSTRAIEIMDEARKAKEAYRARWRDDDNRSDEELKEQSEQDIWQSQYFEGLTLRAAREAAQPEAGLKLKASVEGPLPTDKKFQSGYWLNRARLEALENHPQDALAYYQQALQTRVEPPKARWGKLQDDLTDEARALWKSQGGTETAWAVWSKPPSATQQQQSEGYWEKATKKLPDFELSDLSGKTWKLKELGGKAVLISLWATWCGPCEAELPHLEKFYQKVKNRSDIQVLTFDIDEDLGLVSPYLKEKGYTFPVLPAFSTVVSLLDGFSIPQNWLVDPHGVWQWKQVGYGGGTDADFEKEMMARVDAVRTSQ